MPRLAEQLLSFGFSHGAERLAALVCSLNHEDIVDVEDLIECEPLADHPGFRNLPTRDVEFVDALALRLAKKGLPEPVPGRVLSSETVNNCAVTLVKQYKRPAQCVEVASLGPAAALKKLCSSHLPPSGLASFTETARVGAILGSCPRSLKSVISGSVAMWPLLIKS